MKYVRKIVSLFIAVVFLASVAIGIGVIFAVRNVNVTLVSYSEDEEAAATEIFRIKEGILGEVRGAVIGLVDESKVSEAVESDKYVVEKFEKVYPCTLNVTVRERVELFVCNDGISYKIYDEKGAYSRTLPVDDEAVAVEVKNLVTLENVEEAADFMSVAAACSAFKKSFRSFSAICEKVTLTRAQAKLDKDRVVFTLKSGLKIELQDFEVFTEAKAKAAYLKFEDLGGAEKLSGTIFSFAPTEIEETVRATYSKNDL